MAPDSCLGQELSIEIVGVQFHEILKILKNCQKIGFWAFWWVSEDPGVWESWVLFGFLMILKLFDFFGFWGWSGNFGGRLWGCLGGFQ